MVNRCVVVLVCGSLFGCPPQSGNDAGPGVETALAFCQRYTSPEYACDFLPGCGAFDSRDGCLAVLGAQNGGTDCATSEFVKAVDEGWVGYDAAAGAKCLADFKSTCSQYPASCAGIFVGLKTEGQACHSSSCVTGFYCASDGGCPGTCAAKKPAGTEVRSSVMCIEGTKSHFGLPDGGFGSLCVTPVGQGQPCGDTECNDGLFCNAQKTCVKPFALGEPCTQPGTYSPECEPLLGVACQPATDGGVSRCGKLARRGEACGFCAQDLRCVIPQGQTSGVCGDLGTAGQSCRVDPECQSGLYCNSGSHLCESPRALGADCTGSAQCQNGLRCEYEQPTDGGFTPEFHCRTYDGGTGDISYCQQTEP